MKFKIEPMQNKTLSWWRSRKNKIDAAPPYQRRGRLWSDTDKAYLIDSILNGFDIPKLYLADFTWAESPLNRKNMMYAIIDGKQRMEAIFDFFDGNIALNDDFVFLPKPTLKLAGLKYEDLKKDFPDIAEEFDNFNLSVMAVTAFQEEPINELFVRLNRSKPLTGAEIRNAMAGLAPEVIRRIAESEFFAQYVTFQTKRGQDLNAAAKLLLFEFYETPKETKKSSLDAFTRKTSRADQDRLELSARRISDTLESMTEVFLPRDKLLNSAGLIPSYYWFMRDIPVKQLSRMRNFFVWFSHLRAKNKEKPTDKEIMLFEQYNRSTNDEKSHVERIRILGEKYQAWLKS